MSPIQTWDQHLRAAVIAHQEIASSVEIRIAMQAEIDELRAALGSAHGYKLTADGAAAVSPGTKWIPIGPDTPRGVKLQLISKKYGVAQSGLYTPDEKFFSHWAPLPTFDKDEK